MVNKWDNKVVFLISYTAVVVSLSFGAANIVLRRAGLLHLVVLAGMFLAFASLVRYYLQAAQFPADIARRNAENELAESSTTKDEKDARH